MTPAGRRVTGNGGLFPPVCCLTVVGCRVCANSRLSLRPRRRGVSGRGTFCSWPCQARPQQGHQTPGWRRLAWPCECPPCGWVARRGSRHSLFRALSLCFCPLGPRLRPQVWPRARPRWGRPRCWTGCQPSPVSRSVGQGLFLSRARTLNVGSLGTLLLGGSLGDPMLPSAAVQTSGQGLRGGAGVRAQVPQGGQP